VITPTLLNGWVVFGQTPMYIKDEFNFVHITGRAQSGTITNGTTLFILPIGYRPSALEMVPLLSNNGTASVLGELYIDTSGIVKISYAANNYLTFANLYFLAE
jgi:hypothetical protein